MPTEDTPLVGGGRDKASLWPLLMAILPAILGNFVEFCAPRPAHDFATRARTSAFAAAETSAER